MKEHSEEIIEFNVGDYLSIFKRRWLPAGFTLILCTTLSVLFAIYNNRPVYEARGQLLLQSNDPKSELTGVGETNGKVNTFGRKGDPIETQAKLLTSGLLLESVIKKLDLRNELGTYISFDQARKNLTIKQVQNADILELRFSSSNPDLSASFVNTLMDTYLDFNSNVQKSDVTAAREFIRKQLPKLKFEFESASNALKEFKAKNGIISLDSQAKEYAGLNSTLLDKEGSLQLQLEGANKRVISLKNQLNIEPSFAISISKLNDSEGIQKLLSEIQSVTSQLETQSGQYSSEHPTIIDLEFKANTLKYRLQEQIDAVLGRATSIPFQYLQLSDLQKNLISELVKSENERQALQAQVDILNSQKNLISSKISNFAQLEKSQLSLEQDLNNAKNRYLQLLENLKNLELTQVQIDDNDRVQIIENAVRSDTPVTGLNIKIIAAGLFLGTFFATGIAFILDITDNKVRTVKQIQELSDYPIIGEIANANFLELGLPKLASDNFFKPDSSHNDLLNYRSDSMYRSYQKIYNNIQFSEDSYFPRILSFVNAIPKSENSDIITNLAATIAQAGHRVLLIDANFRNPTQHQILNIENDIGFSNLLLHETEESIFLKDVGIPNLDVITAGSQLDLSFTSFHSRIVNFLEWSLQDYDTVILDSGNLLNDPNSLIISKCCEKIILISKLRRTNIIDIIDSRKILEKLDTGISCLVST